MALNLHCERVRATEHASRDPFDLLKRRHGFAESIERGFAVPADCVRVVPPHPKRGFVIIAENAPRHWYRFAQQRPGFFQEIKVPQQIRVVVG